MRLPVAGIIPAAGRGERLGGGVPKALRPLGGVPMLQRAVRALAFHDDVTLVVVAAPDDAVDEVRGWLSDVPDVEVVVVVGGASRQHSVRAALGAVPASIEHVLVHDAARPLVPEAVVDAVVAALAAGHDAVVPVIPVADSIRRLDEQGVSVAVPREQLRAVQTPQGFRRALLERGHAEGSAGATDDASLVERLGAEVLTVAGHAEAFKITGALDLLLAEALLADRSRP